MSLFLLFHHSELIWLDYFSVMTHCISLEASMKCKFCVLTTTITKESKAKIWRQYNAFKPPLAYAAVSSKAVVLLLLIRCFMYLPLFVGVLCLVFVLLCNR